MDPCIVPTNFRYAKRNRACTRLNTQFVSTNVFTHPYMSETAISSLRSLTAILPTMVQLGLKWCF